MIPLTDAANLIMVTHKGLWGKEAQWKHLNLFTIQAILHKYLMQQQSIVQTLHKLQIESEMYGPLGSFTIVIWGWHLSVRSLLHALLLIPFCTS